jgi:hypothetical protein
MANATWSIDEFRIGDDVQLLLLAEDHAVLACTEREELMVEEVSS